MLPISDRNCCVVSKHLLTLSEKKLYKNLMKLVAGIETCIEKKLTIPALVLIYSAIDTAGWLDSEKAFATRRSFINWTENYLLLAKPLECKAIDLYAARCGLLHTLTPDSQLSGDGKARRISYAWGPAKAQDIPRLFDLPNNNETYVHVEELYEALRLGLLAFTDDMETDSVRSSRVLTKAKQFFSEWSIESAEELIGAIDNSDSNPNRSR